MLKIRSLVVSSLMVLGALSWGAEESASKADLAMAELKAIRNQGQGVPREIILSDPKKGAEMMAQQEAQIVEQLRGPALKFFENYPDDPRRWDAIVFYYAYAADRNGSTNYRNNVRRLIGEAVAAPDISDKTWEEAKTGQIWDMLSMALVMRDYLGLKVAMPGILQGIQPHLEALAARSPDNVRRNSMEMQYVDMLEAIDKQAAMDRLAVLTKDRSSRVAEVAAGKLLMKRMLASDVPMDLKFTALDGRKVDIGAMRGKVVLIDFWATWCVPCIQELPNVQAIYDKYRASGFEVVGIALDEAKDEKKLRAMVAEMKILWPQHFDGKGWRNEVAVRYGINGVPTTFLLDKTGKVVSVSMGGSSKQLEALVKKYLGA